MNGTIYKIQNNINNKIYIGLTTRNVNIRWEEHKKAALSDAEEFENIHLYNGMRKYGLNNFSFSIIETNIIDFNILNEREKYWIAFYNSYQNGYNMNMGGNSHYLYDYEKIQSLWLKDNTLTQQQISNIIGCSLSTVYMALKSLPDYCNHREVEMYDLNNKLINTFYSTRQASLLVFGDLSHRSSIKAACDERQNTAYGYIWHYKDTDINNYYQIKDNRIKCLETNIIYDSISDASKKTQINRKSINRCVLKQQKTAGGLHWVSINDTNTTIEKIEEKRKIHKNAKKIKCIETEEIFLSIGQAKKKYSGDIQACCAGRQKTAGGLHWIYLEE